MIKLFVLPIATKMLWREHNHDLDHQCNMDCVIALGASFLLCQPREEHLVFQFALELRVGMRVLLLWDSIGQDGSATVARKR